MSSGDVRSLRHEQRKVRAVILILGILSWAATIFLNPRPAGAVATPSTTTSYYVSNLDTNKWYNLGCSLGSSDLARAGAQNRLVSINFGEPWESGGVYGTIPPGSGSFSSRASLQPVAVAFAQGYYFCVGSDTKSQITLALIESNYGPWVVNDSTQTGRAWSNFVAGAASAASGFSSQVDIEGGYDMEVGWNSGTPLAVLDGFYSLNSYDTYDVGDASGCPVSGVADCAAGAYTWTVEQRYQAVWGRPRAFVLPEIYQPPGNGYANGHQAEEWGNIARYAYNHHSNRIDFSGVLTQQQACAYTGGCSGVDNTPAQGYNDLYNALAESPTTAFAPRWSNDYAWET